MEIKRGTLQEVLQIALQEAIEYDRQTADDFVSEHTVEVYRALKAVQAGEQLEIIG